MMIVTWYSLFSTCTFLWFVVLFLFCFVFLRFFFFRIPVTIFCLMVTWYLCTLPYSCTSKTSNWDSNLNRSTNKRLVKPPSQLIDELSELQIVNFPQILPRNKDSSSATINGPIMIISLLQNSAEIYESNVSFPRPDCRLHFWDDVTRVNMFWRPVPAINQSSLNQCIRPRFHDVQYK